MMRLLSHFGFLVLAACTSSTLFALGSEVPAGREDRPSRGSEGNVRVEGPQVIEKEPVTIPPQKAAIFVNNTAGTHLNDRVIFFEDQISARVSSPQLRIISREDTAKALKIYSTSGRSGSGSDEDRLPDRNALGTRVDRDLSNQQSAQRLAQALGADFVLLAAIGSFDKSTRTFKDDSIGVDIATVTHTLRGTYKILDAHSGGAVAGEPFKVTRSYRQTPNLQVSNDDLLNEAIEEAAGRIALGLRDKLIVASRRDPKVEIVISAQARDLTGNELRLPDIRVTEDNRIVGDSTALPLAVSATIEIDGLASGTTPARLKVTPGLHKLRISRPGMLTWEGTVNAEEGLNVTPTLALTQEGFDRWMEIRSFLAGLDRSRALTEAEVERLRGFAQMLRQSGFRVDHKSDIKVDTKEGFKVDVHQSLF